MVQEEISSWTCGDNIIDQDRDGVPFDSDPDDNDPCIPDNNSTACNTGGELPQIFQAYTWLEEFVDPFNCSNDRITVYVSGVFKFVFIENQAGNQLYLDLGQGEFQFYCSTSPGLNCVEAYGLSEIETIWECGDIGNEGSRIAAPKVPIQTKKESLLDFQVFPNPTAGRFFVNIAQHDVAEIQTLRVIGLQGNILHQMEISTPVTESIEMDLSNVASGIYLVQLITTDKIETKRIVLE